MELKDKFRVRIGKVTKTTFNGDHIDIDLREEIVGTINDAPVKLISEFQISLFVTNASAGIQKGDMVAAFARIHECGHCEPLNIDIYRKNKLIGNTPVIQWGHWH